MQIVTYKLFGGTMCIMKIFMINSLNQWSQYFVFTVILNIHIRYRHPEVWHLQVTLMQESGGCDRSSLNPSAQGPSHIMSGKSQKSSQSTLPPRKDIVRMKTVKRVTWRYQTPGWRYHTWIFRITVKMKYWLHWLEEFIINIFIMHMVPPNVSNL
jgi:hypothetical protein